MSEKVNNPAADTAGTTEDASAEPAVLGGEALVERLIESDIILEDQQVNDLRLTESFREAWWDKITAVRDNEQAREQMAAETGVEAAALTLEEADDQFVVFRDDTEIGEWPSRAAFIADIALQPTIGQWFPLWEHIDGLSRGELLARLRAFLETCPACEGDLQLDERTDTESGRNEVSIVCVACGQVTVRGQLQ